MSDRLWDLYETVCQEEVRPLDEFVRRLLDGEWGAFSKEEIVDLLRELEGQILANIQVKAAEGRRFAGQADAAGERVQDEFAELLAQVERAFEGR